MTFSLAGRCARTGMVGVAVTTSSIAVGSRCPHAAAGVGAVLTQHRTDPRLGPLALDLMRRGFSARETMDAIVAATPHRHWRQLAIIDNRGTTAAYSGANVRPERGEAHGRDCVAIANIVKSPEVPAAMVRAFEHMAEGALADRLIAALVAGDEAGGEFQPVTSAALLVAYRESFAYVDLRVDDHPRPIEELARLWTAYRPEADPYVVRAVDPENATRPPGLAATR
ncbi:MAG: DUF1028 domain-containing protein [Hyphomicrobiaceae bacterium]